ncbi:hypothetical protein Pint_09207 [Pistacia integerrima]|uniref:Uncharacterized protein n=1 Tax=Pistacia integerrima TaxID=434235 RepID=A0ACC0XZ43_9ROSI|nr:hypothetical protein Pint_09207 [Pistacia integerrima]
MFREEFRGIVFSFEKLYRDGRQLVKGGSNQLTVKQLQQRVGVKPCLADCLDGLMILHDMHYSEYLLKSSLVSALSELALKPSTSDLGALQQLLVDQPNIPKEEDSDRKQIMAAAKWHILGYSCNLSLKLYLQKRLIDICKAAVEVNLPYTEYLDVEWNCRACLFLADVSTEECL